MDELFGCLFIVLLIIAAAIALTILGLRIL